MRRLDNYRYVPIPFATHKYAKTGESFGFSHPSIRLDRESLAGRSVYLVGMKEDVDLYLPHASLLAAADGARVFASYVDVSAVDGERDGVTFTKTFQDLFLLIEADKSFLPIVLVVGGGKKGFPTALLMDAFSILEEGDILAYYLLSDYSAAPFDAGDSRATLINLPVGNASIVPILHHCFANGLFKKPFYFEGSKAGWFYLVVEAIVSAMKPFDGPSRFYFSKEWAKGNRTLIPLLEALSNPLVDAKTEVADFFFLEEVVYVSVMDDDASAMERIKKLSSLPRRPAEAILVSNTPTDLTYFEEELSAMAGCPVKVFSPLSIFTNPMAYPEKERAALATLHALDQRDQIGRTRNVFPLRDGVESALSRAEEVYSFSWKLFAPLQSHYVYEDAFEEQGGNVDKLFGVKDHPFVRAIQREQIMVTSSYYPYVRDLYHRSDSFLYAAAEYEHIMWMRRTYLFAEKVEEKKNYLTAFKSLVKKITPADIGANDFVFPDFLPGIDFAVKACKTPLIPFDFAQTVQKAMDEKALDLDELVKSTDIGGKQLENLIYELNGKARLKVSEPKRVAIASLSHDLEIYKASKDAPGSPSFALVPARDVTEVPAVGDVLYVEEKPAYIVANAFYAPNKHFAKRAILSHFTQKDDGSFPYFDGANGASFVALILCEIPSFAAKECAKMPLYSLSLLGYPAMSKYAVLERKRLSDFFLFGEKASVAFGKTIAKPTKITDLPFLGIDPEGVITWTYSRATFLNEYDVEGPDCNESVIERLGAQSPFTSSFPFPVKEVGERDGVYRGTLPQLLTVGMPPIVRFPKAVFVRFLAPALASLFRIDEQTALELGEGKKHLDPCAKQGCFLLSEKTDAILLKEALPELFAALKDKNSPERARIDSELRAYPFGEALYRRLMLRLLDLGLLTADGFYVRVLPVSSESIARLIGDDGGRLGIYDLCVLRVLEDLYEERMLHNFDEEAFRTHANDAILTCCRDRYLDLLEVDAERWTFASSNACLHTIAHYCREGTPLDLAFASEAQRLGPAGMVKKGDYLETGSRFLATYLSTCSHKEINALADEYFDGRKSYCWNSTQDLILATNGTEKPYRPFSVYLVQNAPFEWSSSQSPKVYEVCDGNEICTLHPPYQDPAEFRIIARMRSNRSLFIAAAPVKDLGWINTDECVFAQRTRNEALPYSVVVSEEMIESLYDALEDAMGGDDDD